MAVCPNCGEDNPNKARFCMVCATPLEQAPQLQAEERKVVSVLFVDLVGFTARSHDADPEDVRAALQPYHQRLKREIEAFGGTVEKFIGDAVMAVFGAPVAHEDDAERAVRAALRITEAIEELNEEADLGLSIRAAVNTGEGLVNLSARPQSGEGMVTGDVVNTASRLQGAAPVNGIVVGQITYRSTKDVIVYDEIEPVALKGKPDPIPIWLAVSARSRFGVDAEPRYRTPFIGRDFDLATLKTAYQRMLRENSLQLVTIVGEPGVGKSRLLAEFSAYADEQEEFVFWRQGRSLPYGEGITFWALGEIIKAHAGINESDSPDVASDRLTTAIGVVITDDADRAWFHAKLAPLVGAIATTGGGAEKEESFTAWQRFFEAIAATRPLVLVFEDLHWADESLLEFIEHLVEWSTGVPILIVCTARPELFEKHPGWGAGLRNYTNISLSPLTDSEIAQLISGLLSQAVLPAEIHAALLERAGGNPLYAEEFIRMLSDRGVLQQRGRSLALDPDATITMPENVQALIAARLDTLPPDRKALLHNAAVIGKVFWSGAVASLSDADDATTRRSLQELARKELVRPARTTSIEGQREYSFWHALTSDVAYGQIPRPQRAAKHQRAARWLEGVAGQRVADHAEVLAYHYESAVELLSTSSMPEQAADLVAPTVHFLVLAGDKAFNLDLTMAERHFERALNLLPPDDPRRPDVLLKLAQVSRLSGRSEEGIAYCEEAMNLFRLAEDVRGEGKAAGLLGWVYWWVGRIEASRSVTHTAIKLLEQVDPCPELAVAYHQAAADANLSGAPEEALTWAKKALSVAEDIGDLRLALRARGEKGWARCELGDQGGLDDQQQAYNESVRLGLADEADVLVGSLANWMWWIESPASALRTYEPGIERSERLGLIGSAMLGRVETMWMLYDLGEWDRLLDIGHHAMRWSEPRQEAITQSAAGTYMALVLAARQQLDEARDLCERSLPQARQIEDLQTLVPALATAALTAHMQGHGQAALDLVEELNRVTRHSSPWRSRHLPTALRVLIAVGKVDKAENFARDIDVTATRDMNCVLTGQSILAEAKGHTEEARDLYEQAAQRWTDYGFVLEEGQAHLGLARCLIGLGDKGAATEPLQKARAIFSRLGAVPLLRETDGYLQKAQAAS